jgi:hypothetical protein
MSTELAIQLPAKEQALEVFSAANGIDPFLKVIRDEVDAFIPDVSTKKGRDEIASIAYKISRSKSAIDDLGKNLVSDLKELPKKIDAERKRVRDLLDQWRDEVRKPLTDWESAEEERVQKHKLFIVNIEGYASQSQDRDSEGIARLIAELESTVVDQSFEEFQTQAISIKESTLAFLRNKFEEKRKHEEEQKELARLRAELQEKQRVEREELIAKEAAEKAVKAEREAAERRELELKFAAEKAEREKLEAIQREKQAVEVERKRIEAENKKIEDERIARERNAKHKKAIRGAALKSFVDNGLTQEYAEIALKAIENKLIPNVSINF